MTETHIALVSGGMDSAVAELLASEPEKYADEWGEIAPRPEEVGYVDE